MKVTLERCKKLLDCGLSIITIGDKKVPNVKWKHTQTKALTKSEFESDYKLESTKGVGIVTGYNNLEVIDVDLKVLPSLKLQQDFWNEYLSFLKDNIDDFDEKFVIYKTINNGYHILYRCNKIEGNRKLAKLEGQQEAIIETRGVGGYVFIYDNCISKYTYNEIKEISELDREMIIQCSEFYNYIEPTKIPQQEKKQQAEVIDGVNPWTDYNNKTSIWDLISDSFDIVRKLSDKTIIRRHGADSAHSGYVFSKSGCMYLFSTATIYPAQTMLSAYGVYTFKYHNGDYKESAKELYKKGFGTRIIKNVESLTESIKIELKDLEFPIDVFPIKLQNYLLECNKTLNASIDYMGSSMLWLLSVIIGNSIKIEVKTGWVEPCSVWICCVGKAGIGKTPSINHIIFPLTKVNNKEIKNFIKAKEKYDKYLELDKAQKENTEEIHKPSKTQFIVNDVTMEALIELHEESKNSIGVFKDELAGWFKDMNKYRAGSDLEFWLSSWSNKGVAVNRKTARNAFVESPIIPVLGGIQPSILTNFFTEENKDNGFIDRMLTCYPNLFVDSYNKNSIKEEIIQWYSDYIINFYHMIKNQVLKFDEDFEVISHIAYFNSSAEKEWIRIHDEITDIQNSDIENEYMKSMLPKQKSYIPRFALLIHILEVYDANDNRPMLQITKESILKAEKLSKYFIANAKKIKTDSIEKHEIKKVIGINKDKTIKDKVIEVFKNNPNTNKNELAELLGISRQTIHRYLKP